MEIRVTGLTWNPLPGAGIDIGVGGNNSAWVIGTNPVPGGFGIFYWDGSDWVGVDGGGVRISVGGDDTPWIVNDVGNIYVFSNGEWLQLPGAATDIGVGGNGAVWIIGTNPVLGGFDIYYWDGSNWVGVEGGGVRISVAPDGTPWLVNDAGSIFMLSGGIWQPLPGAATDIGASVPGGLTWAIGTEPVPGGFGIFYWSGSDWVAVDGAAVSVSGGGAPWIVNSEGSIFSSTVSAVGG